MDIQRTRQGFIWAGLLCFISDAIYQQRRVAR